MALATKCPQCGALFRVVADQLKLRGGLVRCGQCRAVFDAIGSLTYVDDSALGQGRSGPSEATRAQTEFAAESEDDEQARPTAGPSTTLRISPVAPATVARNLPSSRVETPSSPLDQPAVLRRRGKTPAQATGGNAVDGGAVVPDDAQAGSEGREKDLAPVDEAPATAGGGPVEDASAAIDTALDDGVGDERPPSFSRHERKRPRGFSVVYGGGTALLALLAAIQLAVIFRGQLMVHWPQARLMLVELCGVFGCNVRWPTQAEQLAVLGTELQSIPGTDVLELSAVVRNRAGFRQSLPAVEVTLTDARNRPLARKVFTPADYLVSAGEPTARLQEGLAPGSDLNIRIFFEARGVAPAGFLVYPFYL